MNDVFTSWLDILRALLGLGRHRHHR